MVVVKLITFIDKAKRVHGDRYDYSLVEYKNNSTKIKIICHIHGIFLQAPIKHLRGQNCPSCAGNKKLTTSGFIGRAREVHGDKYDYSKVEYISIDKKVIIFCFKHGYFHQSPYEHLRGHGCRKCGNNSITYNEFIHKAKEVHGNKYDYAKAAYIKQKSDIVIICPEHGRFYQTPLRHLKGGGCHKCAIALSRSSTNEFIDKSKFIHGDKYDYSRVDYHSALDKVDIICRDHGVFTQRPNDHLQGHGCPNCLTVISSSHQKIIDIIPNNINIENNNRDMMEPYEIDLWLPDYKFGIECHGYYWHGINNRTRFCASDLRNKHYLKSIYAENNNISLMQIFDYELINKFDLIKSMIYHKIGLSNRIYARKCSITYNVDALFFDYNHMYGNRPAKHAIGLVFGNDLVAAISLSKHHNYDYEIIRYCCKKDATVVGGFSKLLKSFCAIFKPRTIFSYADRRYGNGNVYDLNGFVKVGTTKPNYCYIRYNEILSRNKCQKHKLQKLLGDNYDHCLSESDNMINNGYTKLYDAGHDKWVLNI